MLPHEFPPWETVYGFFNRWTKAGVLERVHDTLREQTRVAEGWEPTPSAAILRLAVGEDYGKGGARGYLLPLR